MRKTTLLLSALLYYASTTVHADVITGNVSNYIDGDTIVVNDENIRLDGIDAPEYRQRCENKSGKTYRCGEDALEALKTMIGGRPVRCEFDKRGTYGRPLSTCFVGGRNINREMALAGHAVAFIKYDNTYVSEEETAKNNGVSIWAGEFVRPVEYREQQWAKGAESAPDPNCLIKGNINNKGVRIYHTPWSSLHYKRTKINTKKGERWFCTEGEARQAGWRAPYR